MYKILSRALNNRLNLIVNRVCSRAQKGFNEARYTQEVLINVIETIAHCNTNGVGHRRRHGKGLRHPVPRLHEQSFPVSKFWTEFDQMVKTLWGKPYGLYYIGQ